MPRRRLADFRVRFGSLCVVLAPVLSGCAGATMSCSGGSTGRGSIGLDQRIAQTQNAEFEAFMQHLLA